MLLRQSLDDLAALSGAAAGLLGIPDPAFVEKDYWVVELLRSLVAPLPVEPVDGNPASAEVLFKGGTSLSKAYGLIDRFSEDVDILVVCQGLGRGATEKRVLRPLCVRVLANLGLREDQAEWLTYDEGRTRNVQYRYPRWLEPVLARPEVKLEMGVRGGILPGTVRRTVRSYIADYVERAGVDAEFDDLTPVDVEVIAPVRTLAEKLALLHHAGTSAAAGAERALGGAGRHFYDVYRLLSDAGVVAELETETSIREIAADVDANSARNGWAVTPRPAEGYASSVAFDPDGPVRRIAESAYNSALGLIWGPRPTFENGLAMVRERAELL